MSAAENIFKRAMLDKTTPHVYSMTDAFRIGLEMFNGRCYICGEKLYNADGSQYADAKTQSDHVVSPKHGGTGIAGNMLAICVKCNNEKGDTHFEDFLKHKPKTIEKIKQFQNQFDYAPIEENELKIVNERISLVFEVSQSLYSSNKKQTMKFEMNY